MPTTLEQKQRRTEVLSELKALSKAAELTGGAFTPEQRTKAEALKTESNTLKDVIAQAEADEGTRGFIVGLETELSQSSGRKTTPDALGAARYDDQGRVIGSYEATDEEVTLNFTDEPGAVAKKSYRQLRKENSRKLKSLGYQPWGEFKDFSDFTRQGLSGNRSEAFGSKVQKHYEKLAISGMSEAVGSDGGYLVMPEFSTKILDRVYSNDLWSRTDHYNIAGNSNSMTFLANAETSRATGSRHGGLRGYWLPEGGTKTSSKPTFRSVTLKLVKLAVVVYLTDELIQDTGTVLTEYVSRKAAEEFNFMIGDALVNGNGVGQPLGLLNWPSLVVVSKEAGQLADTLETENIIKMYSRFYGPNRDDMIWLHNQDIEPELFTMTLGVGTGGVVTYMPPGGLSTAPYATLMGRPIFPTEFNPTLGDQGDILAADLGQMLSISKGGIAQSVSIHVEFLTDQTALRFVMRLNAGPWENSPLTPYKGTNTQSNVVALEAR